MNNDFIAKIYQSAVRCDVCKNFLRRADRYRSCQSNPSYGAYYHFYVNISDFELNFYYSNCFFMFKNNILDLYKITDNKNQTNKEICKIQSFDYLNIVSDLYPFFDKKQLDSIIIFG